MFGYVIANKAALDEPQLARYRAYYCGLCRALRERHGAAGRLTLTYDMTFLVMLLTSLYEPEAQTGACRCLPHPIKPQAWLQNAVTDYCADMNVALAYHNCRDDWEDEKSAAGYCAARALAGRYAAIKEAFPRQCAAIEAGLQALHALEASPAPDADAMANAFGSIMGEIFAMREDEWADKLRRTGSALGRFVYMMDAYDDLPADRKRGRSNPLLPRAGDADYEERCERLLTLLIGECAEEFEKLPLVDDVDLMRNVLYSGVWTKYTALRQQRKEPKQA